MKRTREETIETMSGGFQSRYCFQNHVEWTKMLKKCQWDSLVHLYSCSSLRFMILTENNCVVQEKRELKERMSWVSSSLVTALTGHPCLGYMGCVEGLSQGPRWGKVSYHETLFLNCFPPPWEEASLGSFVIRSSTHSLARGNGVGLLGILSSPEAWRWGGQGDRGDVTSPWGCPPSTFSQLCLQRGHVTEADRFNASPQALGEILTNFVNTVDKQVLRAFFFLRCWG